MVQERSFGGFAPKSSRLELSKAPNASVAIGAQGRYVRVQLSDPDYLSLAEVQVFSP